MEIYPDASKHKDKDGHIPIEYAIANPKPNEDIIDTLFVTHPVDEHADDGMIHRAVLKIMKDIKEHPATLADDSIGWVRQLPTDARLSWSYLCTCNDPEDNRYLEQVEVRGLCIMCVPTLPVAQFNH